MIWFLRLFAAFRDMEQQVRESGIRSITLHDKVRDLEASNAELRLQLERRQDELIAALKEFVRPASVPVEAIPPRAIHGRDYVRLKTEEFYAEEQRRAQAAVQQEAAKAS